MAGASIPYPVNYIINVLVIILFAIVLLIIATYRYYKSQAARAQRRMLTGRKCLNRNMEGVKGNYPPKKVERMIRMNELRRQREAEAAEREYEIATHSAEPLDQSELTGDDNRQSRYPVETTTNDVRPAETLPAEGNIKTETSDAIREPSAAAAAQQSMLSVGKSHNNARGRQRSAEHDLPQVSSAAKATQTSPREESGSDFSEHSEASVIGSFEDSVMSFS